MFAHEKFDVRTFRNDIALVRMKDPLDLNGKHSHLKTICLPGPEADFMSAKCIATGWGETTFSEFNPSRNFLGGKTDSFWVIS